MASIPISTRAFLRLLPIFLSVLLWGCANTPPKIALTAADKTAIHVVSVAPDVVVEQPVPYIKTLSDNFSNGTLGELLKPDLKDPVGSLSKAFSENNINVAEMVRTEFMTQLNAKNAFTQVAESGGDGVIKIRIHRYGLFKKSAFSLEVRPILLVQASLERPDGTIAWRKDYAPPLYDSELPSGELEYFVANPKALRDAYQAHAAQVATSLVDDLSHP